ncbi:MAG: LptF/LptG family permease [Desulfuromonadales bacterium]
MPPFQIYRYILQEITAPAGLALFVFTFILLMGRILKLVEMVINKGVPLANIVTLFTSLLPAFLVITLPLSFLLGVLLGFGRMSADSEITALKSSGISLYKMLIPVLALALVTSMATAALTLAAEPAGNAAFRREIFKIASSHAFVGLQAQTFNDDFAGLTIYANQVDERTGVMEGVFISDERADGIPSTILARKGRILSNQEKLTLSLRLENGSIHRTGKVQAGEYQTVNFTTYDINLTWDARP